VIYSYLDAFEARWLKRGERGPRGGAVAHATQPAQERE
jgi:hypothetical protein